MSRNIRATSPRTRRVSVTVHRVQSVESSTEIVLAVPVQVTNREIEAALEAGSLDEILLNVGGWKQVPGESKVERLGHGGVRDVEAYDREPHVILWTDEE